jgi:tRNA (guanine37-N1)-methyltransferase
MKAPPIVEGVEATLGDDLASARIFIMAAGGVKFTQQLAHELSGESRIALICGHYEGIDDRVRTILGATELSIGDVVLTGGELPAMVVIDAVARLAPGVIDDASIHEESFDLGLLEYPHFTRPVEFRGESVPEILLSGHHAKIAEWRAEQSRLKTVQNRPDLLASSEPAESTKTAPKPAKTRAKRPE